MDYLTGLVGVGPNIEISPTRWSNEFRKKQNDIILNGLNKILLDG